MKGEGDLLAQKKKERAIKKVQGGQGDAEWGPLATQRKVRTARNLHDDVNVIYRRLEASNRVHLATRDGATYFFQLGFCREESVVFDGTVTLEQALMNCRSRRKGPCASFLGWTQFRIPLLL